MKKIIPDFTGVLIAAFVTLLNGSAPIRAELRIDITSGKIEPLPIAIPALAGGAPNERRDKI